MYDIEKELLIRLCQKSNDARQAAFENELRTRGVRYENWGDMALVVPFQSEKVVVLCAHVFARNGIPSICLSSGPADTDFRNGIWRICETLHNNHNDNNFGLLNFSMIEKVSNEAKNAVNLMAA